MLLKEGEEIGSRKIDLYKSLTFLLKTVERFPKLSTLLIFDLENEHQAKLVAIYIVAVSSRTPEELKLAAKHLKTNKGTFMSTLEMLLKEGEEIGIKKGEEIGIKKEKAKREAYNSLVTLLKTIEKFPKLSTTEIVQFTEVKKELVIALKKAIATKDKKTIHQVINKQFLPTIKLSKMEQAKIDKLVNALLKNLS